MHPLSQLKSAALTPARRLAAAPPIAVAGILRGVVGAEHSPLDDAIREERKAFLRCAASEDQAEGLRAFIDKRRPVFTGR